MTFKGGALLIIKGVRGRATKFLLLPFVFIPDLLTRPLLFIPFFYPRDLKVGRHSSERHTTLVDFKGCRRVLITSTNRNVAS